MGKLLNFFRPRRYYLINYEYGAHVCWSCFTCKTADEVVNRIITLNEQHGESFRVTNIARI